MITDNIKELVKRLKQWGDGLPSGILLMREAASALEATAGEVCDLEARCETAEKERDRLKNALSKMTEFHHSTSEKVAIARKALGGA